MLRTAGCVGGLSDSPESNVPGQIIRSPAPQAHGLGSHRGHVVPNTSDHTNFLTATIRPTRAHFAPPGGGGSPARGWRRPVVRRHAMARAPRRPLSLAPPFARYGRRVITLECVAARSLAPAAPHGHRPHLPPPAQQRSRRQSHGSATPIQRSHTSYRCQRRRASIAKQGRAPLRTAHAHPCTTGDSAHHSPHSGGMAGPETSNSLKKLVSRRGFEPLLPP
jgi:hypothetical protein